jgi:chemotaxis protein CheX
MTMLEKTGAQTEQYREILDQTVEEVFSMMMGLPCTAAEAGPAEERETVSAVIGLAGTMSGACVLRAGKRVAIRMAEQLAGMAFGSSEDDALDPMVKDAVGEVCNMVAGAWKGKLPELASACMLSTPTVVTGSSYELHPQRAEFRLERSYRFEEFAFSFTIFSEGPR